jgi:formate hydrogenlyase subunit 6/NADH:ubiquinone oxidoreductase subunit I
MFKNCSNKIKYICSCVIGKKESKYRFIKSLFNLLMTPMYLALKKIAIISLRKYSKEPKDTTLKYYEMIALTDKSIYVDEKCDGCAVCEKVCPVKNIKIVDSKPVWQHRCEMCLACDEWCPKRAIHHWSKVKGKDYHHPSVTLSDMMTVTRG